MIQTKLSLVFILFLGITCFIYPGGADMNQLNLMPIPEKITRTEGSFIIDSNFTADIELPSNTNSIRTSLAARRFFDRLAGRTGFFFSVNAIQTQSSPTPLNTSLRISFKRPGNLLPGENESYVLTISPTVITLTAETDLGILHGLETLLQLLSVESSRYVFPCLVIEDKPRFTWRGLMIDSCRHFFPVDVIKRNLDGMAAVKLNVFHWHLSEDQGFRVECKSFPKLHQLGSDGLYYTQEQVKDIIQYASDRGIRVVPEFDIPGHSTSWLTAYPEYASAPGPYSIERLYGVFDPTFDPTNKKTYKFFDKFFKEMAKLFPDPYMHIGGDENNGKQWDGNKSIQEFKKKHDLKSNDELQAYFNKKILEILTKYNKRMMGWDEIFQPGNSTNIMIHSWRGKNSMVEAAKKGYNSILSNGYYIDLAQTTEFHYLNDPIPVDSPLNNEEKQRIWGGEATMWAELISWETIDSRIWPRTAAIAERFWSPQTITDVRDMYRRLDIISLQLEELGLTHIKNQEMLLRRLVNGTDTIALKTLVDVIEPLKGYNRHAQTTYTFFSPFTRVVDAAMPDAARARCFTMDVVDFIKEIPNSTSQEKAVPLINSLILWKENHEKLKRVIAVSPVLKEIESLSENLSTISGIGLKAIKDILYKQKPSDEWLEKSKKALDEARKPVGHAELMVVQAIESLLKACTNQ